MGFDKGFYLIDHRLITLVMVAVSGEIGFRRGFRRRKSQDSVRSLMSGTGAAMLGLLGLLLGFTLSMAVSRWDARREYTDARIALDGSRGDRAALRAARSKSEALHAAIWSAVERADQPGRSPAVLSSLITAANEVIDIHELRLASIENFLPAPLFLLLLAVAAVSVGFLSWSFGAANQGGRSAMLALGLLIGAVLLLIMDVNRPQRGRIDVGVESLERVAEAMASPKTHISVPEKGR